MKTPKNIDVLFVAGFGPGPVSTAPRSAAPKGPADGC
jgi:hypothetical protein